jgi:hypothetical protein
MIVNALFTWLQSAQYLSGNPWQLVNKKTGDDRDQKMLDTKALSQADMAKVLRFIDDQPMSASSWWARRCRTPGSSPRGG